MTRPGSPREAVAALEMESSPPKAWASAVPTGPTFLSATGCELEASLVLLVPCVPVILGHPGGRATGPPHTPLANQSRCQAGADAEMDRLSFCTASFSIQARSLSHGRSCNGFTLLNRGILPSPGCDGLLTNATEGRCPVRDAARHVCPARAFALPHTLMATCTYAHTHFRAATTS